MPVISVTRLRVRSLRYLPAFLLRAIPSSRQARRAPGNLGVNLLNDARWTFWTCTGWQDEASMRAFMMSGAHRKAMPTLLTMCDEAALVHWQQDSAQLPDWEEAHRRLSTAGRRSKVKFPSPAHQAFEIPRPRV